VLEQAAQANALGWGVYVAVAWRRPGLGRYQRGGKADLIALPALFVDVDHPDKSVLHLLHTLPAPPSCVIDSGGGFHAYWWLDQPTTDFNRATLLLDGLRQVCQADSVTVVHSMRLPGSLNTKPTRQRPCTIVDLQPRRYSLDELERSFLSDTFFTSVFPKPRRTLQTLQTLQTLHLRERPSSILNPDLIQAVVDQLCSGGSYWKSNGYLAACCPGGHHHDRPGMHFNFDPQRGIGHCFGKHGTLLLKDLCGLLGIRPADFGGVFRRQPHTIR
jgi:hypothetical protein